VIGTDLKLFNVRSLGEVEQGPSADGGILTVSPDGVVHNGARVGDAAGSGWQVGPDGLAYGVASDDSVSIQAVADGGMQPAWPVSLAGVPSVPAFGRDGRIVLTVGNPTRSTTKLVALDPAGGSVRERSAAIPIVTVDPSWADTGGCSPSPQQPVVAGDGTIFVYNESESTIVAVDPSLKAKPGWPYEPRTPLVMRDERYIKEDAYCPYIATPAVGPDGTLFLPLQARDGSTGGTLVAVGPDGRVRAGWPVGLKRPGSEFWSVVVGTDGTAYALAIEPESSRTSSASVLAIAPDSSVRYATTIMDP
jgi:outer membrane protein assembly factor BamB